MANPRSRRSAAIPALHAAQELHGWCSPEAIEQVAAVMRLTPAYLTSVATFYDMLETTPRRATTYVCTNISCSLRGGDEFLEAMQAAAEDARRQRPRVRVPRRCDIAPMASVNGEYVGPLVLGDAADRRGPAAGRTVLEPSSSGTAACVDPGVQRSGGLQPAARTTRGQIPPGSVPRATPSTAPARPHRSRLGAEEAGGGGRPRALKILFTDRRARPDTPGRTAAVAR